MAFVNLNEDGYPFATGFGTIDEVEASVDLIDETSHNLHLYLEKLNVSVYKAAAGGNGVLEIKDHRGNVHWTTGVDTVKDIALDFGKEGIRLSSTVDIGLQAVLSGAAIDAAANVGVAVHYR